MDRVLLHTLSYFIIICFRTFILLHLYRYVCLLDIECTESIGMPNKLQNLAHGPIMLFNLTNKLFVKNQSVNIIQVFNTFLHQ